MGFLLFILTSSVLVLLLVMPTWWACLLRLVWHPDCVYQNARFFHIWFTFFQLRDAMIYLLYANYSRHSFDISVYFVLFASWTACLYLKKCTTCGVLGFFLPPIKLVCRDILLCFSTSLLWRSDCWNVGPYINKAFMSISSCRALRRRRRRCFVYDLCSYLRDWAIWRSSYIYMSLVVAGPNRWVKLSIAASYLVPVLSNV